MRVIIILLSRYLNCMFGKQLFLIDLRLTIKTQIMSFNGKEGEQITLATAKTWTASYRKQMASNGIKGHFFGKDILQAILDQSGAEGIRMYYGIDDNNQQVMILVAADANEDDMVTGIIADKGTPCPPRCGSRGGLSE
jgi:hypothetical protein